jgi:cell division protein FtsZ
MTINLTVPDLAELKPRITVFGVGGAGGNAVNNMIESRLEGVEFVVANTDAQALLQSAAARRIQMGNMLTQGLGAGSHPEIGASAAEEALPEIIDHLAGSHMVFITAGMGGGTGTGAAPVIARAAKEQGILTVGVVTKPFQFEGQRRAITAERGIEALQRHVDTLIVIPNQNLFRVANEKTTFAAAFAMADQVLYSGVASITELMTKEGLINLDFADVRAIMSEMGRAMMGTGEASGEKRAIEAAEAAISNPLLDDVSMRGARGLLISITGGPDLTLYEVDEAATRIREEVDPEANIILGATFDEALEGTMRVSVVATGLNKGEEEARAAEEHQVTEVLAHRPAATAPSRIHFQNPVQQQVRRPAEVRPNAFVSSAPIPAPVQPAAAAQPPAMVHEPAEEGDYVDASHEMPVEPVAVRPAPRMAPRMPAAEEFPPHVRPALNARSGQIREIAEQGQARKQGFLSRLTSGFARKPEPAAPAPAGREPALGVARPAPQRPAAARPAQQQAAVQPQARENVVTMPIDPMIDDAEIEIPAFLRRQAN